MKIDRDTTSEQVLALLDVVESDEEDKIDNLMNHSDTEFIMEEEIPEEKNENDSNEKSQKRRMRMTVIIEMICSFLMKRVNPHEREECTLKAEKIIEEIQEHYTPFDMLRKVTNLDELINFTVVQSNLYSQQNGREFQTNAKEMMVFWA